MKRTKIMAIFLAILQIFILITAAMPVASAETALAGKSSEDPKFHYGSKAEDYINGQAYYYLENQYVKTLIGTTKTVNDQKGPMSNGAIMDAVSKTSNRENLDWTQFIIRSQMDSSWNTASTPNAVLDFNELEVKENTIIGKGVYNGNTNIRGEIVYSLVEDTPLIQMEIKLTNTSEEDFQGYLEYLVDPDESGEQQTYVPGVGWTLSNSNTLLANGEWTDNYIFEGNSKSYSGYTAHAILWNEEEPTGLVNDAYIFGVWFDASVKAGESKTITLYHLPHDPGGIDSPYSEAEFWARVIREDDDPSQYGMVKGTVTDLKGNPIQGSNIVCKYAVGEKQGQIAATATTDRNGAYRVRVEKDVYTLTATALGYQQGSQSVDLNTQTDPRADILLDAFSGARITKDTSLQTVGGITECKPGDYVMENELFAMAVASLTKDAQLKDSSTGRILDVTSSGEQDAIDWIFTSWISDVKPHQQKEEGQTLPGDSWLELDTRFDRLEVVSETATQVVLKASGVYHHDLAATPDGKEAEIEQIITLEAGKPYAEIQTTIQNTQDSDLELYVGDVIDLDMNPQCTYVPGVGQVTADYNSPIDEKPTQPWISQYSSSQQAIYAMLYEEDFGFNAFGSVNWIMGYQPVSLKSGEAFTYNRRLVVLDTEGYSQQPDAMKDYYNAYAYGISAAMTVYDGKIQRGQFFPATVTVSNSSEHTLENVNVTLELPYMLASAGETEIMIPSIAPGASETANFSLLALEGGRTQLKAQVVLSENVELSFADSLSVDGEGYYSGDNHTHSQYSDGSGTIRQNVDSAYENKLLNWVYSTDHNAISQKADTEAETVRLDGNFVNLTGTEVTSSKSGHALAYGVSAFVPEYRIGQTIDGKIWTWQDTIDQVNSNGGVFYVAHPNYPGLQFSDPYGIRNYTGIEVWNGFYHAIDPDQNVNNFAFDYWDKVNCRGEKKYFGIANSDGHNAGKMGDPYIKGEMTELTSENIHEILATGRYYGSNGPDLRFSIDGVGMAETLNITESRNASFNITAFDPNYKLTNVKLIKNVVTGSIEGISNKEVVFEEDLTGKNLNEYHINLNLPVEENEFYRIEVISEGGTTGNGGKGQGQGLGFAYSNPIWIDRAEKSNAHGLENISYEKKNDVQIQINEAGNVTIHAEKGTFDKKLLHVQVSDGATSELIYHPTAEENPTKAAFIEVLITAEDASQTCETIYLLEDGDTSTKPNISVEGTVPESGETGKLVTLPDATAEDATGNPLTVSIDVTRPDGQQMETAGNTFIPLLAGDYTVVYSAVDADGKRTARTYIIHILQAADAAEMIEVPSEVYINEDFVIKVNLSRKYAAIKLVNENGRAVAMTDLEVSREENINTWTITTAVGTAGLGRSLTVLARTGGGEFEDLGLIAEFDVLKRSETSGPLAEVKSAAFAVKSTSRNTPVQVTVVTNDLAYMIKATNETNRGMGKRLLSKTVVGSEVVWIYEMSIATAGVRAFSFSAAKADGVYSDLISVATLRIV